MSQTKLTHVFGRRLEDMTRDELVTAIEAMGAIYQRVNELYFEQLDATADMMQTAIKCRFGQDTEP